MIREEKNVRLLIGYDGTRYAGWQRQKNSPTIQGTIEDKLAVITDGRIVVNGAGRTDAGVHAQGMVANFRTRSSMTAESFRNALNSMLPGDIRIMEADLAAPGFHARFDARGKTYRYDFYTGRVQLPEERLFRAHIPHPFILDRVTCCLEKLIGNHDFSSFEGVGSRDRTRTDGRGAVRTLFRAHCSIDTARTDRFSFSFTGDGFLRHMVRNLVGTLLLVGSGRITVEEFQTILALKNRAKAGPTAPAHGLFLERVHYTPFSADTRPDHVQDK